MDIDDDNNEDDDDECDFNEEVNTNVIKRKSTLRIIEDDDDDDGGSIIDYDNKESNDVSISYSKPENFKLCVEDTEDAKEYESLPKEESGVNSFCRASTEDLFGSQMGEENAKRGTF